MKKLRLSVLLMLALALLLPAVVGWAQSPPGGTANAQANLKVVKIIIEGNRHVSSHKIKAALPFKVGDQISEEQLNQGARAIMALGLFQDVTPDYRHLPGGVAVSYTVEESPVIKKIIVKGNVNYASDIHLFGQLDLPTPFTDYLVSSKRVLELLKEKEIKPGRVLNRQTLRQVLGLNAGLGGPCPAAPPAGSLCKEYRNKGYFLISVAGDVEDGSTLVIQIIEWQLEGLQINGLQTVPESVVHQALSGLRIGRPIKLKALQQGLQKLSSSIYFDPINQQDVSFAPGSQPGKVKLVLEVHERRLLKKPISLHKIVLSGNTLYPASSLLSQVKLPDHPVNNYELLKILQPIYRRYHHDGYILMKFAGQELQGDTLRLQISEGVIGTVKILQDGVLTSLITSQGVEQVQSGSRRAPGTPAPQSRGLLGSLLGSLGLAPVQSGSARVGRSAGLLGMLGLTKALHTRPQVIIRELRLGPGDIVNRYRLSDSYRNLVALGYFKTVNFNFETPTKGQPGQVNLLVEISEQDKLGNLNGSLTFNKDGLTGKLEVALKNLAGSGQDLALSFDRGLLGKGITNWSLKYDSHSFFQDFDLVQVKLYDKHSRETSPSPHLLSRVGGELSLGYPMGNGVGLVLGLRHENFTKEFETQPTQRGVTDTASLEVNHDTRNNPAFPTQGGLQQLKVEQAGGFTVGPRFSKFQATLLQFVPTWPNQTVALRLYGGWGISLPSQERFSLGGSTTLRGFKPVSSATVALLNLEYRFAFQDAVSLALFTDLGSTTPWKLQELKKSFGLEMRITVPYLGLMRAGLVWQIKEPFDWRPRFEFGMGQMF